MNDLVIFDAGEKPVLVVRKHVLIFMRDIFATSALAILPFIIWHASVALGVVPPEPIVSAVAQYLGILWLLVAWVAVFVIWTEYYLDTWIVTDRRVFNIQQIGLFRRVATSCDIDNIQEIVVHTDNFLQTLFHYGTLEIQTAGPTSETMHAEGVPHPERMRAVIEENRGVVGRLEQKNKKQEELLHMVAHEVKGYLGKNAAVLASIAEGDYGAVPDPLKNTAQAALSDTRSGVSSVMDILEGSNLGAGTVQYRMKTFDIGASLKVVVDSTQELAKKKGLALTLVSDGAQHLVVGDETKIRDHILRNLIENAVRYTPSGSVAAGATQMDGNAIVWVKDTGVGITPEDMQRLFTEGGHGAESRKVNPASTGYGLFIAKQVAEAHGGRLWAESDGAGTGSRFYLLLPLSQDA